MTSGPGGVRRAADPLGFKLAMLRLLLFLFFAFDREHVLAKLVTAVAGCVGTHYVFEHVLRVPLPCLSLSALRSVGC